MERKGIQATGWSSDVGTAAQGSGARGEDGIGDENEGFEITNTATWRQKVEEGDTTEENQKIQAPAETAVGMNPMDDVDFDWDDI